MVSKGITLLHRLTKSLVCSLKWRAIPTVGPRTGPGRENPGPRGSLRLHFPAWEDPSRLTLLQAGGWAHIKAEAARAAPSAAGAKA